MPAGNVASEGHADCRVADDFGSTWRALVVLPAASNKRYLPVLLNRQPATVGFSLMLGLRLPAGSASLFYLGKTLQLVLRRVFPRGGDVGHS
jgi:hypothetical protein